MIRGERVRPLCGPFIPAVKLVLNYMSSHRNSSVLNRLTNKTTPLSSVVSNHMFYYPTPSNLNYN